MTAEALVEISHLGKTFPGQVALRDVNMGINYGEIHGLVGENGSGKSTLIKVLSGFHVPDPGSSVTVAGERLPFGSVPESRAAGLRFMHQDLGLIDEFGAVDNIGLESGYVQGRGHRIRWKAQQTHAMRLLAAVRADLDLHRPVGQLRPVERSTVAIARALDDSVTPIRLLVLDEPTAALPPAEVEVLFKVLRQVRDSGVSILYVSHRLDEILGLVDRVSVLRDGRFEGTHDGLNLDRSRLVKLIVGESASAQVDASISAAVRRPAVQTSDVAFRFEGICSDRLDHVDLVVHRGEILGVAGLDGSGREEVAMAMTGASPAALRVRDPHGSEHTHLDPRLAQSLGIALVLGNRHPGSAVREFSVRENVSLPVLSRYTRLRRVDRQAETAAVTRRILDVDLRPPDPARAYALLSGGNQQKSILARWLNTNPALLVMDDPTSGVDIGARHAIYELVRGQAASGVATVICSADLEDFVGVCDRVIALAGGRVAATLTGSNITEAAILEAILQARSVPAGGEV